jgi:mannitol/fructose-specific phosphotransferase system IIA component (Ntr-type)
MLWYGVYVRGRINRESAFVYLVKSILSKEFSRSHLEEELKEIALERDNVVHDRFDNLIRQCAIIDLDKPIAVEQVFRRAAELLATRLKLDENVLYEKLISREQLSSTIIQPGLAIPHVVVDGQELFDVVLIRCRDGIRFPNQDQPVKTMFVLVGSPDERNYHLRALMAIAHVVQEHDFQRRWLRVTRPEHLRDIFLLSKRQRDGDGDGEDGAGATL